MYMHMIQDHHTFDGVAIKAFINFRRLNEIADIGHPMWLLRLNRSSSAATLDANSTEGHLTQITFRGRRSSVSKEVLAIATESVSWRRSILEMPCMFGVSVGVWNRLWARPAVRIPRETMRTWPCKIGTLI